jgi:hypothetical protein
MKKKKQEKSLFPLLVKGVFAFILLAINIRGSIGIIEILPAIFPDRSLEVTATVTDKYVRMRQRTSTARTNTSSARSTYIEITFDSQGKSYSNTDLVSDELYTKLEKGEQVKFLHLAGIPHVGLLKENQAFAVDNTRLLAFLLLGLDLLALAWLIKLKVSAKEQG